MAALGRKYSVTNGRFQEVKFHRPLSSNEFEEVTVASRPTAAIQPSTTSTAGFRVERSHRAPTHFQQVSYCGYSLGIDWVSGLRHQTAS